MDGTEKEYPGKVKIEIDVLDYIVTDEPKDASAFTNLCVARTALSCLEAWEAHDISKANTNRVLELLAHSYDMAFSTAIGKAFGTYEENSHPAAFPENIRMSDFKKFNN